MAKVHRERTHVDEFLRLLAGDEPGQVNPLLGDYAAVQWVQHSHELLTVDWRHRTWSDWLAHHADSLPDVEAMPAQPLLPDPLLCGEGEDCTRITTPEQWPAQRRRLAALVQHYIAGTVPPPPDNLVVASTTERQDGDLCIREVELRFGPGQQAVMHTRLFIPPGNGPLPVLLTQKNEGWLRAAARRGYIGCAYAGGDGWDDTEAYGPLYPDDDFCQLMRRAWGCGRAMDYLLTLPQVHPRQIALIGHSRNGFQALLAAAFDERITAVIPASATVGLNGFRYGDTFGTQTLDEFTYAFPSWLHPRLRCFVGREHRLPLDMNTVMALVAPRALLLTAAIREADAQPWALERMYDSVRPVYEMLGAADRLALRQRHGDHGVPGPEFEVYLDFLDTAFGRSQAFHADNYRYFLYSFEHWQARSGEQADREPENIGTGTGDRDDVLQRLEWLLGEQPVDLCDQVAATVSEPMPIHEARMNKQAVRLMPFDVPRLPRKAVTIGPLNLAGDALTAWLFEPNEAARPQGKLPVAIYLHEYAYATGFNLRSGPFIEKLTAQGWAVLAMDLAGFHSRIEEGTYFYDRFPRWSLMAKMLFDVRSTLTALQGLETLDTERIFLVGNRLGGAVALLAAASDARVAGCAVINAFTPWRSANPDIEGIRAYACLHGLLPRLGLFTGREDRVPVDFDEIIACIAPRPTLVIASQLDRHAEPERVAAAVRHAEQAYAALGASAALAFVQPENFCRFTQREKDLVCAWLRERAG